MSITTKIRHFEPKLNEVFFHIANLTINSGENEIGQTNSKVDLSH